MTAGLILCNDGFDGLPEDGTRLSMFGSLEGERCDWAAVS